MAFGTVVGWIGIRGVAQSQILDALELVESPDARKPKASIFTQPNGWTILFTLDFGYPTPERMAALSAGGRAIAVSADDRIMFSVVREYVDGKAVFSIEHDGGFQGSRHIAKAGNIPAEWEPIFERLSEEQDQEDQEEVRVDCLFDGPLELAKAFCGYRHDEPWPEDQQPQSTLLVDKKTPGLLGRLFGR